MLSRGLFLLSFWILGACPASHTHFSGTNNYGEQTEPKLARNSSFLWMIEGDPPSYFFGTIHVPYTRVWDAIPSNMKDAFNTANKVFFEVDLTNSSTLTTLSQCQLLPENKHISEVIPSDLFFRLKLHFDYVRKAMPSWLTKDQKERGIYADYLFSSLTANWERKKPIWVALMVFNLRKSSMASRGFPVLDVYLIRKAKRQDKYVGAIEDPLEQCVPFDDLTNREQVVVLKQAMSFAENDKLGLASKEFDPDQLVRLYRSGKLDARHFEDDMLPFPAITSTSSDSADARIASEIDEKFMKAILTERNKKMAARVIDLLVNDPGVSHFFAFGAGHFLGQNSVLDIVQSAGFSIRHVSPNEPLYTQRFTSFSKPSLKGTVVSGTFDDLSQEEKNKAYLKFLQHHQMQQQQEHTRTFKQLLGPDQEQRQVKSTAMDEKVVEESLRIWYGMNMNAAATFGQPPLAVIISVLIALRFA